MNMTNGFGGGYKTTDDLMTLGGPGATTQYPGVSKVLNSLGNAQFTTNISQQDDVSKLLGAISKLLHALIEGYRQIGNNWRG